MERIFWGGSGAHGFKGEQRGLRKNSIVICHIYYWGRNMRVSEKGKNFQLGDVWLEYYMRVLYLCESNCGLATIRNYNFPQKKILKLELSEGLDEFWEGGHMVFRGTGGGLVIARRK